MSKVSIDTGSSFDGALTSCVADTTRRLAATPPGICPIQVIAAAAHTAAAQTCGKCVPCRDGLPRLAHLLDELAECRGTQETLDEVRELATMVNQTSDCAIGYEAGRQILESLESFAAEYATHIETGVCGIEIKQTVPCESLCPAHVNVPAYIALTGAGRYADAVNMVRKDNPFPTACALVCEHPCEIHCRRTLLDAPINIRGIKKFAVDQAAVTTVDVPSRAADSGCKVAVIGGGPSGLTCAYYLAQMGHKVVVFEARKKLGGMLRYGIPAYRFPRERLDEDIAGILAVGNIEAKMDVSIGAAEMKQIQDEFDATYVAIGAHMGKVLKLDNIDAPGVISAVDLLRGIGDGDYPDYSGKKVVVVGGGNVAMDCARTAVRAGADAVSVAYRRRQEDMTALATEIESAIAEGVEMLTLESPAGIEVDETGACCALLTQPQMISVVKRGRPSPVDADKPQNRVEADIIMIAIGQDIGSGPFEEFGMKTTWGRFDTNEYLEALELEGFFVGGDCQSGPSTVIRAVGSGKAAARNIDEYLGYHHTLECPIEIPEATVNDKTPTGRVNITERPARERKNDFEYVENPMSAEEAEQECGRCLRCDVFGCGPVEGGRIQYD